MCFKTFYTIFHLKTYTRLAFYSSVIIRYYGGILVANTQIAETMISISIKHRSDTFASDRCIIDIDRMVLTGYSCIVSYCSCFHGLPINVIGYDCIPAVHYNDVIMGTIATQITSLTIVYSTVYSDAGQINLQSSAVTRKMFPFDDVIMNPSIIYGYYYI